MNEYREITTEEIRQAQIDMDSDQAMLDALKRCSTNETVTKVEYPNGQKAIFIQNSNASEDN